MAEELATSFAVVLRRSRTRARLSQEELALAAGLSPRTVSDLERGIALRPHRATAQRLADALGLQGPGRAHFDAMSRSHRPARANELPPDEGADESAHRGDPQGWLLRVAAALDERGVDAARSIVTRWQHSERMDPAWLAWVNTLISLTEEGRLRFAARRPLPATRWGSFLGRHQQAAEVNDFLDRVEQGRGGLALVLGPAGIGKSRLLVEVLAGRLGGARVEWMTFDRGEGGYRGWRRLLAPLWIMIRRGELAPAGLLAHASILDDILLAGSETDLTGKLFPGEVAEAVAALLDQMARREPLVLVFDDAHRGGASSDHLLVDVARRISACSAAIIAALRQDELEEDSPIRQYGDQADSRAAPDVVVPIHMPGLDLGATAALIREQTGAEPPAEVVGQVLRQTGGRPQLIKYTQLQASAAGAGGWVVGKLDADGIRVLDSTIQSRPDAVRAVLQAAALCAVGGCIELDLVADITGRPAAAIEQILDDERQRGSILVPHRPGYWFQHDSWIDALITSCPPARLRPLHARCLTLLQAAPAPDPQRLAWHALGAGAPIVGAAVLVALAREAAGLAVADYAFGTAAELYEAAARHSTGTDRIDLLIWQADALRFRSWKEARQVLRSAVSLARRLAIPGHEARALIHLERLTWTYGLDERDLTERLREVLIALAPEDTVLRTQVQATLAMRLSVVPRQTENEQVRFATSALHHLPSVTDPLARADILLGIRGGLQDNASPEELLRYDSLVMDLGLQTHSAFHIEEALAFRIVDIIRAGQVSDLPAAIRAHRQFAERSGAAIAGYFQATVDAMLALARGEFEAADRHTSEAARWSSDWGDSVAHEVLMAQAGWLLYETGEVDALADVLLDLPDQNVGTLNQPVWSLGAALIHAERDNRDEARRVLWDVATSTGGLRDLPDGPSRIGILATAAMVLGHPALEQAPSSDEAVRLGTGIADLLAAHRDVFVLAGWPAVMLGSKHRYIGLAWLAAGQPARAAPHLARAAEEDSEFAVLRTRTRFDLARALLRQSSTHQDGVAEMESVKRAAADLRMTNLAAQAGEYVTRPGP
jgi:transcriptional regulator with XRE-family HTH domain